MVMKGIAQEGYDTVTAFLFSLGFFSEIFMIILTIALIHRQSVDLIFYLLFLWINGHFNRWLKDLIQQRRPPNPIKFLASEHFSKKKVIFGMPSGHSQSVFFSITYLFLFFHSMNAWIYLALFIAALMLFERWYFHNHTVSQLCVGAAVGALSAYVAYEIKNYSSAYSSSLILGAK